MIPRPTAQQRWFLVALLAMSGYALDPAAQRPDPAAARFVGAWRLVSWEERLPDGTVRPNRVIGPKGIGSIMYSDSGRMCAMLMNPERAGWPAEGLPSDAAVRTAFDGFVAYCGTYEVNDKEHYVVHHVEMDKAPNIVGTDRRRSFVFSGNRLALTLPSPPREGATQSTLTWERVGK